MERYLVNIFVNHWHDIYHGKPGWIIVIHWEKIGMDGIKIMGFTLRSSAPWWAAKWKTPNWASFVVFFWDRVSPIRANSNGSIYIYIIYIYMYTCYIHADILFFWYRHLLVLPVLNFRELRWVFFARLQYQEEDAVAVGRSAWGWWGGGVSGGFWIRGGNGYGSIPIDTIFNGMDIHLPAILGFTKGTRLLTHCQIGKLNGKIHGIH